MQENKKRWNMWYWFGPLAIQFVISILVREAAYMIIGDDVAYYATEITCVIALVVLPILCVMYRNDHRQQIAEERINIKTGLLLAAVGVTACIALNIFLMMAGIAQNSETYQDVAGQMYSSPYWVQFAGLGILIPMTEEMLYRGMLYRRMRELLPVTFSVGLTAVLFGVNHGNIVQFLFAAVLGVMLAWICEKFCTVKASIILHISVNLTSLLMTWTGGFAWIMKKGIETMIFLAIFTMVTASLCVNIEKISVKNEK